MPTCSCIPLYHAGLLGLVDRSILLMVVSLVMSSWDTITEIREPNLGKAAFMALGVVRASLDVNSS